MTELVYVRTICTSIRVLSNVRLTLIVLQATICLLHNIDINTSIISNSIKTAHLHIFALCVCMYVLSSLINHNKKLAIYIV